MKRINTKTSKKIAAIILAAFAVCSVMGCSVEKNFTTTETHTYTDANGNTTTTTTTNNNGEVTTETYTETADEAMTSAPEDDIDVMEVNENESKVFSKVPVSIANEMGWDVAVIQLKMSSSDEWSDNFLGEDMWLDNGETASGINVTYDEEDRFIDILVADSTGDGVEFDQVELPTENNDEIVISLEYDETDGSYHAYTIE